MFSRIFPNREEIKKQTQPLEEGEFALLKFFDENLPKDEKFQENDDLEDYDGWLIFSQSYLNGSRPDIILFNPKIGLQIIEVKDRNLSNYYLEKYQDDKIEKTILKVSDGKGVYKTKKPTEQVNFYKEKIIGQLLPFIGEYNDNAKGSYGIIKTGLYFHKSDIKKAKELFFDDKSKYQMPIFGYDFLKHENLGIIVPDIGRKTSMHWKKEWNKEVLRWLKPPYHSKEQGIALQLNKYQQKIINLGPGHHRIRGVAGSGKTEILAYKAGELASKGKKVLILTFNITLWHMLRDKVQRSPFQFGWGQIKFDHFHGFCSEMLNKFGRLRPNDDGDQETFFRETIPNEVIDAISGQTYDKYDAILIDEGQDYCVERYRMLSDYFLKGSGEDFLMIVCDKKQNIYGRETLWLDKRKSGTEKFGDWQDLKTVVRLTEKIAKITQDFSEHFKIQDDLKIDSIERPNLFKDFEEHIVGKNIEAKNRLLYTLGAFNLIKDKAKSNHPSDIVILVPSKKEGLELIEYFKIKKIDTNHVFSDTPDDRSHKKSFWMGDSRLKICTIHSFKGWECRNVIVCVKEGLDKEEASDKLFYTAITRTKENLIIINSNKRYKEFIDELPIDKYFTIEKYISLEGQRNIEDFQKQYKEKEK